MKSASNIFGIRGTRTLFIEYGAPRICMTFLQQSKNFNSYNFLIINLKFLKVLSFLTNKSRSLFNLKNLWIHFVIEVNEILLNKD